MTSKVIYEGNLRVVCEHVKSGSQIVTDAPTDNNGKGERFSPTDLVATALASCMITVMGIKANESGIPFSMVSAEIIKVMAAGPRRITEVKILIEVADKWNEKQRELMENTGRSCPVAKSLHSDLIQNISFVYK
ncbi:MAG: osmotically inducible protein OsmC [Bacteroidetes bacterium]|nr:MAG: osmotically inducible protein OsmC [Bacteroidota bacterium]